MRRIPLYAADSIGLIGLPRIDAWKLRRWMARDGEVVTGPTVIAELECDKAVVEHEIYYNGILRHVVAEGDSLLVSEPIGFIACTDEEYSAYLQLESARRISITVEPSELRDIEDLKADESNEAFVARVFRAGLAQIRSRGKN